jgi:hypothetical protein
MIAPAVHAVLMLKASLMPSKATPMVAMVVHELPDSSDTKAQMKQALAKNN